MTSLCAGGARRGIAAHPRLNGDGQLGHRTRLRLARRQVATSQSSNCRRHRRRPQTAHAARNGLHRRELASDRKPHDQRYRVHVVKYSRTSPLSSLGSPIGDEGDDQGAAGGRRVARVPRGHRRHRSTRPLPVAVGQDVASLRLHAAPLPPDVLDGPVPRRRDCPVLRQSRAALCLPVPAGQRSDFVRFFFVLSLFLIDSLVIIKNRIKLITTIVLSHIYSPLDQLRYHVVFLFSIEKGNPCKWSCQ